MNKPSPHQVLMLERQVRERLGGVSRQWLWRRSKDGSDFPKPVKIKGRKFWRVKDLEDFEANLSTE